MKKLIISIGLLSMMVSCTDAKRGKFSGLGEEFKIEVYSGGQKIKEYISTGKVASEKESDGYYFVDKATGKLTEVSCDVIITEK